MQIISAQQVDQVLDFPRLISALQQGFAENFTMPPRQLLPLSPGKPEALALLPSWNERVIAVKAFSYFPDNAVQQLPALHSSILLYRRDNGVPLALVDGSSVTCWRTAAVSALASRYLARTDAKTLLLLGTGRLALPLIQAHLVEHDLQILLLWGRNTAAAQQLSQKVQLLYPRLQVTVVPDIAPACGQADIIVSATGSATPLLFGHDIPAGCHVDLLGNHSPQQRECDSELVRRASVYVDDRNNVLNEAGELLIPMAEQQFSAESIRAELAQLCQRNLPARQSADEITLFKSVGTALSDLLCAELVLQRPYFG
jgi:1-pyrroline-2-carboxylate reductase [NAD(P)H]